MSHSPNVTWQDGCLARKRRWQAVDGCGATIWFTGLPASGKSTFAAALEQLLIDEGLNAYLLDGDNLRHGLCGDLGFTRDDREENVRRVGELARLFADAGVIAVASLVSPYAAGRDEVRATHERDGLTFLEVFVNTPLPVCQARDPKGLYKRALAGELPGFTGIDDPYEPPRSADIEITHELDPDSAAEAVLRALAQQSPSIEQRLERAAARRRAVLPLPHVGPQGRTARAAAGGGIED
jgi:adenylyl-sulfate kinase